MLHGVREGGVALGLVYERLGRCVSPLSSTPHIDMKPSQVPCAWRFRDYDKAVHVYWLRRSRKCSAFEFSFLSILPGPVYWDIT